MTYYGIFMPMLMTITSDPIRIEVAPSRPDYLPTLSAAKTSKLSLLVKHHVLAIDETSQRQQQQQRLLLV